LPLAPGRFDRQILVSSPDLAGRQEILGVHTKGKPLAADVDLHLVARQTAGLTGADLANVANEAAIFAARDDRNDISQTNFEAALERVVGGLQQRRIVTEKERRILAYHEGGHAVMAYLMGDPVQKATIVARGDALGYTFHLPDEDRYLHTREELIDWMKIGLAGRAAEQVVFGRVTNGAANDLEKVTSLARAMVFEYGMSEGVVSRTMRADNYALSEETKRLRDSEQARLTDGAYEEAIAGFARHGDVRGQGEALNRLCTVFWDQGETRRSRAVLLRAIELLEQERPSPELCSSYVQMAADRVMSGHSEEAPAWADKALALAERLGHLGAAFLVLSDRIRVAAMIGDLPQVEALGPQIVDIGERGGLPWRYLGHLYLGLAAHRRGNAERAEAHLRNAVELEPQGAFAGQSAAVLARHLAYYGRVEEVMELFESARSKLPSLDRVNGIGSWSCLLNFVEAFYLCGLNEEAAAQK
jgi:tetratricopeptide (TPR) repeat protein